MTKLHVTTTILVPIRVKHYN